jgi:hypothetical protein
MLLHRGDSGSYQGCYRPAEQATAGAAKFAWKIRCPT